MLERWKVLYSYIRDFIKENNISIDAERALLNRIVVEQLPLSRNVVNSNLKWKAKQSELSRILNDSIYRKAYKGFDYSHMPIYWKVFYWACEIRQPLIVTMILYVAEKFKKGA